MELAELILREDGNPSASRIQTFMDSQKQTYIKLSNPLPIVIEYLPVAADSKGNAIFFGDLYGWLTDSTGKEKS
jgi:murein L,D-transpeptidase YcbB/YkuD